MSESNKAVFLSYASQDAAAAARICEALRAAGIEVWFDQSELRGGDAWDQKIRRQIRDCALFVPVISEHTQTRAEGYFRLEWRLAEERTHLMGRNRAFVVPVCMDRTPEKDADVPDSFVVAQWTRLPGGQTPAAFCERVKVLLDGGESQIEAAPSHAAMARVGVPAKPSQRKPMLIIAGVVAAFVVAALVWRMTTPKVGSSAVASVAAAAPEKSIAVLPFVDMSEKKDQEYFADGIAEEILNLLVKVPGLKVIGRTSSFQFKGQVGDLRKIGATLGAVFAVEGSVRRSGDHMRVTAQLIDTRTGAQRWSETYDRDAKDVLKVQGEIAASLVRALQLEVSAPLAAHLQSSLRSAEAYDNYLRGLHASDRYDQPGFEEAVAAFRQALELDPSLVSAGESLALNLASQAEWHFVLPQKGYEEGRSAAEAVLKLDPNSALAHAILGYIHTEYDWNWAAAAREMSLAVSLAPHNPVVLYLAATERLAVGPWDKGITFANAATTVDPLDPGIHSIASLIYSRMGRMTEAESAVRRALEISPTLGWGHHWLGVILVVEGRAAEALTEMQKESAPGYKLSGLAVAYFALRRTKDSDDALAHLESGYAGDSAMRVAEVYAYRNQRSQSLEWLERAYAQKDASLYYVKGDPLLKNLESDPRYKAFLRKMNLPET